jgi:hypothetical protein
MRGTAPAYFSMAGTTGYVSADAVKVTPLTQPTVVVASVAI